MGTHTVYNFVQVRSKAKGKANVGERERAATNIVLTAGSPVRGGIDALHEGTTAAPTPDAEKSQTPDETRRKIEALKQRPITPVPARRVFDSNPEEPLRLLPNSPKKSE